MALAAFTSLVVAVACGSTQSANDEVDGSEPAVATPEATASSGEDCTEFLRAGPYQPTDPTLFSPALYGGPEQARASTPRSDPDIRAEVASILNERFPDDPGAGEAALALLDDPAVIAKVPDLNLRGALALLTGTIAEAEIQWLLDHDDAELVVADVESPTLIGRSVTKEDGSLSFQISSGFAGERAALLAPTVAHEILHNDGTNGLEEEQVMSLIDTIVYAEQLLADPTIASSGTRLAQVMNGLLLARLNSRQAGQLTYYDTDEGALYPGSITSPDLQGFSELKTAERDGPPTPGSPILDTVVAEMLAFPPPTGGGTFDEVLAAIDVGSVHPDHLSDCDIRSIVIEALKAQPVAD